MRKQVNFNPTLYVTILFIRLIIRKVGQFNLWDLLRLTLISAHGCYTKLHSNHQELREQFTALLRSVQHNMSYVTIM